MTQAPSLCSKRFTTARTAFTGSKATQACTKELLDAVEVKTLLAKGNNPYMGDIPPTLKKFLKSLPNKDILGILDQTASAIQKKCYLHKQSARVRWYVRLNAFFEMLWEKFHAWKNRHKKLPLNYIGAGDFGRVYKISTPEKEFAFKIFRTPEQVINQIEANLPLTNDLPPKSKLLFEALALRAPYQEAANGFYFTARNTSDYSKLYLANPSKGWTLMEYINPGKTKKRSGTSLREQGYFIQDDFPKNRINGIRVDHGGVIERLSDMAEWQGIQSFLNAGATPFKQNR